MLLNTVLHDSLHLGVKTAVGRSFIPSSAKSGHLERRKEVGETMFTCSLSKHFLFKRFSNITVIAGAGISIREDSSYITATSGRLWQDLFISYVVVS